MGRVVPDGGEKRGVRGYISRGRSGGSRNREVYGLLVFRSQKYDVHGGRLIRSGPIFSPPGGDRIADEEPVFASSEVGARA